MNWEEISRTENEVLSRMAVDGGWLYRYMQRQGSDHGGFVWSFAIAFVPIEQVPVGGPGDGNGGNQPAP